ncbi:MAG: energy-coupled thiamine transporter ThiT [Actinobacteria bacterium]|nr:MAG: energy-coupled thiamine transporter ThiT [Actinomycetota bacterium]
MTRERLQVLLEIALAVALTAVLHVITIYQAPQGGRISLEMLPIFVIAFRRGLGAGVLTGLLASPFIYLLEPFFVHPLQWVLDYPLAFALVGTAGLFRPLWLRFWNASRGGADKAALTKGLALAVTPGVLLGGLLRFGSHVLSGVLFIQLFAPQIVESGQNVLLYSVIYNGTYMLPATLVSLVAMWILAPALERVVPAKTG